jgi:tripartite-type tricarboxylate transporter receptor subunit TctC
MKKVLIFCLVVLLAITTGAFAKDFPKRDITNVVVWSAGGGTDTCNRIISAEMAKFLGVNVNVINKTGGVGGSVGMSFAYKRPADGYTLCGLSESCVTAGVQGGWKQKMSVWDYFIVGGSPDVISVTPDTPYKNLGDLIEAAKKITGNHQGFCQCRRFHPSPQPAGGRRRLRRQIQLYSL